MYPISWPNKCFYKVWKQSKLSVKSYDSNKILLPWSNFQGHTNVTIEHDLISSLTNIPVKFDSDPNYV